MFVEKKFLKMKDGAEIYAELKESGSQVWIIGTHGVCEHLGRHRYLFELFGHDFNILQYDLRGHGRSYGRRVYIEDFSLYKNDLEELIRHLIEKYRMKRYVLFGHSMGALITSHFLQNFPKNLLYPERVVLNAPPCGAPGILGKVLHFIPSQFFKFAESISYSIPVVGLVKRQYLSHDPRVKEDYIQDQLNSSSIESRLIWALMKTAQDVFQKPMRVKCPAYVSVGTDDLVVGVDDLVHYFTFVEKTFQLKKFEGAYHEIHNEIDKYKRPYFDYLKQIINEVLFLS